MLSDNSIEYCEAPWALRTFNAAASEGLIEPLFIGRGLFGKQDDPFTQGSVILAAKS